jgi:hypothetical protein
MQKTQMTDKGGREERIDCALNACGGRSEEGFLTTQADTFAGANVKEKSVGLLRSK